MADIDCFIASIRIQESGGNYSAYNPGSGAAGAYQFEPGTWRYALSLAGLSNWSGTPANHAPPWVQDAAAKALMGSYFSQFGSWYDVAEAWYGGPGAVGHPRWGGGPGYPDVGQYADQVIARMNAICNGTLSTGGGGGAPQPPAPSVDLAVVNQAWQWTQGVYNGGKDGILDSLRRAAQF